MIVGALSDDHGGTDSGVSFIFFGSASMAASIDASAANVKLIGGDVSDRFGVSVCSAGDFNGDGFTDVIGGADQDDDGGTGSGGAFIFFGSSSLPGTIDTSAASVKLVGADPDDQFGEGVGGR